MSYPYNGGFSNWIKKLTPEFVPLGESEEKPDIFCFRKKGNHHNWLPIPEWE